MSADPGQFLEALEALPPQTGVSFRGASDEATFTRPGQVAVSQLLLPTTRNLDAATDAGRVGALYAVMGLNGRDITPFSARRDVPEVLFLPGAVFVLARTVQRPDIRVHLVLEVEPGAEDHGPADLLDQFAAQIDALLDAYQQGEIDVPAGKFVGDIGEAPHAPS